MSLLHQLMNFLRYGRSTSSSGLSPSKSTSRKDEDYSSQDASALPTYEGLERYQLIHKMGDGAFSIVYKATDTVTQETVAVKVVRKYEMKPVQRADALKEVQIMRTLKHPHIVELKAFLETPEYYFLILECCQGGELFLQIVHLTYFSENLARHCICQVAEAVRYLHEERGVVHRDIKPENLLFEPISFMPRSTPLLSQLPGDENKVDEGEFVQGTGAGGIGCVKIADFGLSKVVWDEQTNTPCGTVGYTAPEIVKNERYSKSVDMWALGCVLYTLLCGFPPFYADSVQELTEKVATGDFVFLSPWWDGVSASAKDLICHLLCVDPEERYTISQFMQHPWLTQVSEPPSADLRSNTTSIHLHVCQSTSTTSLTSSTPSFGVFPGLVMRDMIDISYAVQRMTEESFRCKAWRRRNKSNPVSRFTHQNRMTPSRNGTKNNVNNADNTKDNAVDIANETPEAILVARIPIQHGRVATTPTMVCQDRDDTPCKLLYQMQRDCIHQPYKPQTQAGCLTLQTSPSLSHPMTPPLSKHVFELNLENATLAGRRKQQQQQKQPQKQQQQQT